MFSKVKEFSKTIKSILTGTETKRVGKYKIPQFGNEPAKGKDAKYTDEEALVVIQEALNYFGADDLVRHLNWSIVVATQRKSNNDLRAASAGLSEAEQAQVSLLLNLAKRTAEAECGTANAKGELVVDRKSDEYVTAMRESLAANLAKPKYAHLEPVFKGSGESAPLEFDLTVPGSLGSADDETDAEKSEATDESATA